MPTSSEIEIEVEVEKEENQGIPGEPSTTEEQIIV